MTGGERLKINAEGSPKGLEAEVFSIFSIIINNYTGDCRLRQQYQFRLRFAWGKKRAFLHSYAREQFSDKITTRGFCEQYARARILLFTTNKRPESVSTPELRKKWKRYFLECDRIRSERDRLFQEWLSRPLSCPPVTWQEPLRPEEPPFPEELMDMT